jgi:hypothetical protein
MQFRATAKDIRLPAAEWLYLRDVQRPVCYAHYHLWSPFTNTEQGETAIHTDWLIRYLMDSCPTHGNDIRTPDPSSEKCRSYWREEARAQAIQEAEEAGLEGTQRQAFVREREEIYYAEGTNSIPAFPSLMPV